MNADLVLRDLNLVSMRPNGSDPFGFVEDAVIVIKDGLVAFAGPANDFDLPTAGLVERRLNGALVLPGFVCAHNMVLWQEGATPSPEQDGASYRRLVAETAELTAQVSDTDLIDNAQARLAKLLSTGATAYEIKSGFGRTTEEQLRLAGLARRLQEDTNALSVVTLYAGHFIPDGSDPDEHLEEIVTQLLPKVYAANACDAIEVFCDDEAALDIDNASTILEAFYRKKTPTRVSCDRFSDSAGATLPASFYSRAATFLGKSDDAGLETIASVGATMVLVPEAVIRDMGAGPPDIETIRASGGRIAVSCESGPDGFGELDLLSVARRAASTFDLTASEALAGITTHAATALGIADRAGAIGVGMRGDLVIVEASTPEELLRDQRLVPRTVIVAGQPLD
jgi:imidazolonepropionase